MKKIIILSANPKNTNQLRLDEEVREIQLALERSQSREEFQLITKWAVRINDLRRAMLDESPQIVHFSGHGIGTGNTELNNLELSSQREVVRLHSQPSGIILEDDSGQVQLVSTKALTELFELFKDKIDCILLNACYSQTQAEAISQHIDCVIGMNSAILDNAAIKFSIGFYDAIGAGRTYVDAFKFGCNNINLNNIPDNLIPAIKSRNPSKSLFPPNLKEKKANMSSGGRTINMGSGNYNERIQGNYVQGNYYAAEQEQSYAETATEIQKLLEQLDKSYPSNTTAGKMAIATEAIEYIDSNQTLAQRVLSALKAGGVQTLTPLLNHPAANFVIGALEDWQKTKSS
ncbi:MAG: CHAT domain-containing protein [Rhizonema sp. NSF051]|nr:CHAT domain-containing protein [Rhizonema sp. NSF051]